MVHIPLSDITNKLVQVAGFTIKQNASHSTTPSKPTIRQTGEKKPNKKAKAVFRIIHNTFPRWRI